MASTSTEAMNVDRSEAIGGDPCEDTSSPLTSGMNGGAAPPKGSTDPATGSQRMNEKAHQGFTMKINGVSPQRKRKREMAGSLSMSLPGSSSSSSDDDEQETKLASRNDVTDGELGSAYSPGQGTGTHRQETPVSVVSSAVSAPEQGSGHNDGEIHEARSSQKQNEGWRVKLYRLNADGSWDDCGTGSILCLYKKTGLKAVSGGHTSPSEDAWVYQELGEPTLCMHSEVKNLPASGTITTPKILLRTRILLRDAYQRQGDNIITWCEPYLEEGNPTQGVDLALSFQDIAGCLDIWRQITQVQSKAVELFRKSGADFSITDESRSQGRGDGDDAIISNISDSHEDVALAPSQAHDARIQRQHQQTVWTSAVSEETHYHVDPQNSFTDRNRDHHFEEASMIASYQENNSGSLSISPNTPQSPQLPNPPGLANLEEIAQKIAAVQHIQPRESLAMSISENECSYLKSLLSLFPSAESCGDKGSLATLATCVKYILLLNDPSIIELIVSDEIIFEDVCSTLEYDPDLRDKANHRWFLRERLKFRTVAVMEDEELVASIHRAFRVTYLRDTLLRPTMDESSLSTLSSLQAFTHADVVKGVTMSPAGTDEKGDLLKDSYLAKIIRILGRETEAICDLEWRQWEDFPSDGHDEAFFQDEAKELEADPSTVVLTGKDPRLSKAWKQYLAPQDESLRSRRMRRRGCISFLRELFNMVRISLQQSDKDDFFAVLVSMDVDLAYETKRHHAELAVDTKTKDSEVKSKSEFGQPDNSLHHPRTVNLLALLSTILADPKIEVTEKGSVLEVVSGIVMHDPSLVRRRCLDSFVTAQRSGRRIEKYLDPVGPMRPHPNEKRQVLMYCPPSDLLGSLVFLLVMESDAGILLQVSEIMRTVLDTDMLTDHGPMGGGIADETEGIPPGGGHSPPFEHHVNPSGSLTRSDQNQFLSVFYDHYVQWLAAPYQHKILRPVCRIPTSVLEAQGDSATLQKMIERFEKGVTHEEPLLRPVTDDAVRSSFVVELLNFCVRAHLYRMKSYLLRSRILGNVLKVLNKPGVLQISSGERCLTLAALRFLRSVLSVKDEFYNRHIIQHNLFAPVFAAFRTNPVGDNLVSSAIVEMCDFIRRENIKSLVEYIVTQHLSAASARQTLSLEDVSSPYVTTLTTLRRAYEKNLKTTTNTTKCILAEDQGTHAEGSHLGYLHSESAARPVPLTLNERAREDQRKFREIDQEESYFDADDDDTPTMNMIVPPGVDEIDVQESKNDELLSPPIFSLMRAPLLNGTQRRLHDQLSAPILEGNATSPAESAHSK